MHKYSKILILLALLASAAASSYAEKYALVAGVGEYPYLVDSSGRPRNNLDGPRPDAEFMVRLLEQYGFKRENMTVLINTEGTRDAILGAVDRLIGLVHQGDQVVIYYSGHGTSGEAGESGFGMEPNTGAIVPSDIRFGTNAEVLSRLIIGKRDLRDRLSQLERKATVLVVFDACFSGESVKGITFDKAPARYLSLADLTRGEVSSKSLIAAEQSHTRAAADYPYSRVVYFSAAAKNQVALDISAGALQASQGRLKTVDGQPHGAFSNVLMGLLAEGKGTRESCRALFNETVARVHEQAPLIHKDQDPQLLFSPANTSSVDRPCFQTSVAQASPPPPPPQSPSPATGIRVAIDRLAAKASFQIHCETSQPFYHPGENTVLRCVAPDAGYLQVISYGMGDSDALLLFPNKLQPNNAAGPGEVQIPKGVFNITNDLPPGAARQEQVMLVLFSTTAQDARSLGVSEGIFTGLEERALRSQRVTAAGVSGYGAAELVFEIHK